MRRTSLLAATLLCGCPAAHGGGVEAGAADAAGASLADAGDAAARTDGRAGDVVAGACQGVDGGSVPNARYADLNITAAGFTEHEGQRVFLLTRGDNGRVLGAGSAMVTDGAFAFHFPNGYRRSADQEILWLLDQDGDGVCNDVATDHTGYLVVNAADPGSDPLAVAITDNHVEVTPGGVELCDAVMPFGRMLDMNVRASGFDAHAGRTVHLLTRTAENGAIFAFGDAVVAGGAFAFHFQRGYERFAYQDVFFFVDVDGDGRCTPGVDHPGYAATAGFNPTQNVPIDVAITDNHVTRSSRGADVCVVMNGCPLAP